MENEATEMASRFHIKAENMQTMGNWTEDLLGRTFLSKNILAALELLIAKITASRSRSDCFWWSSLTHLGFIRGFFTCSEELPKHNKKWWTPNLGVSYTTTYVNITIKNYLPVPMYVMQSRNPMNFTTKIFMRIIYELHPVTISNRSLPTLF